MASSGGLAAAEMAALVDGGGGMSVSPARPSTPARFLGGDNFAVLGSPPDLVLNALVPRFVPARRPRQALTLFSARHVSTLPAKLMADRRPIRFDFPRLSGR
jgi:hypothetical protein